METVNADDDSDDNSTTNELQRTSNKLECSYCNDIFTKVEQLKLHKRAHYENKSFTCKICSASFMSYVGWYNHHKQHREVINSDDTDTTKEVPAENTQLECTYCYDVFSETESLRLHRRSHYENKNYDCKLCKSNFTTYAGWRYHYRSHTNDLKDSCESCDMKFYSLQALIRHISNHKYFCSMCNKAFVTLVKFREHEKEHHQIADEEHELNALSEYRCTKCDKTFRFLRQWRNHLKQNMTCRPHSCNKCGKGFLSLIHLESHTSYFIDCAIIAERREKKEKIHTNNDMNVTEMKKMYPISRVNKQANRQMEKKKSFICNNCDTKFTKIHLRRDHWVKYEECRPYGCKDCYARFINKNDIESHVRNHSYKCRTCLRRFMRKIDFQIHSCLKSSKNATNRAGVLASKNFVCLYCCEAYANEEELQNHIDHVSEYLFICSRCYDTFTNKCTFGYHVMTTHGIDKIDV